MSDRAERAAFLRGQKVGLAAAARFIRALAGRYPLDVFPDPSGESSGPYVDLVGARTLRWASKAWADQLERLDIK